MSKTFLQKPGRANDKRYQACQSRSASCGVFAINFSDQSSRRRILLTGGAGCIGSALCRRLVESGHYLINVDKLTYAGNRSSVEVLEESPSYRFVHCDIADSAAIAAILAQERIDSVLHLAAETHVDRSITSPDAFIETNILGTFRLLQSVLGYWQSLEDESKAAFRFHHVSTDEVFGDADSLESGSGAGGFRPSSPYSASKAAAEHLVQAWYRTYGLPVTISNASNIYGPRQFPDKLIPSMILHALRGQSLPIYGDGGQMRRWLHVEDHARALELVLSDGKVGETYHFSGDDPRPNLAVVEAICAGLDRRRPRLSGGHASLIKFVADRPGHDRSYARTTSGAASALGWTRQMPFEDGLATTIDWYLDHTDWWLPLAAIRSIKAGGQSLPASIMQPDGLAVRQEDVIDRSR